VVGFALPGDFSRCVARLWSDDVGIIAEGAIRLTIEYFYNKRLLFSPVTATVCIQDIRRREIVGEDLAL
jgi:hypothetical protein